LAITNSIIFNFVRRSTKRVQPMNNGHVVVAISLNPRDARLLKHMLIMFAAFCSGWIPIYIIGVIDWNGNGISYVVLHALQMLPMMSFVVDIIDLFFYNHELRTYCINKLRNRRN
jgi:hypothetical protein